MHSELRRRPPPQKHGVALSEGAGDPGTTRPAPRPSVTSATPPRTLAALLCVSASPPLGLSLQAANSALLEATAPSRTRRQRPFWAEGTFPENRGNFTARLGATNAHFIGESSPPRGPLLLPDLSDGFERTSF